VGLIGSRCGGKRMPTARWNAFTGKGGEVNRYFSIEYVGLIGIIRIGGFNR
jgi:hypothetical protein